MKHSWYGNTEVTAAWRAYMDPRAARPSFPVELYDAQLPGLGYATPLVLRWCDQPFDVTFPTPDTTATTLAVYAGGTHVAASGAAEPSPKIQRGQRKESIGVEVDSLDVDVFLDDTEYLPAADGGGSTPRFTLAEAVLAGLFDGAVVTLRRVVLPLPPVWPIEPLGISPRQLVASGSAAALAAFITGGGELGQGDTSLGAVTLFGGLITESSVSLSKVSLTVKSALEKLNIGMPRNIYQTGCLNDLGDRMCKVAVDTGSFAGSSFAATVRISATPPGAAQARTTLLVTTSYPTDTALPHPLGYFEWGTAQFTTGTMAGLRIQVEKPGIPLILTGLTQVSLTTRLPRTPVPGDTVILRAGCRKTVTDCTAKFGNFVGSKLTVALGTGTTTVTVATTANCADAGRVKVDAEIIAYTGRTATTYTGCTRGASSTTPATHAIGALVYAVEDVTFDNEAGVSTVYPNVAINGTRFRGMIRVPPPDSAV